MRARSTLSSAADLSLAIVRTVLLLLVMVSLLIADELADTYDELQELREADRRRATALSEDDLAAGLEALAARVDTLAARIEQANPV